jgi:hypothetical protein
MQCLACGSDTNPALPHCTWCNAALTTHSGSPEGPGDETVTQLSPEPWAIPAEPEIWRPPPRTPWAGLA